MDWKRGPMIGHGSSAAVYLATTPAGELFAVKSADLSSSISLQKERHLISQLCSPFVVKFLGSDTTLERCKSVYNLFLEYVPGGTISDQILKRGGSLEEGLIRFYAYRILQGLDYLHRKGFVHCDVKGQNILIGEDGELKIADFGCAKRVESESAFAGTPAYMAPEVARGEEQSFPADIWALGCTVIEMATGSNPWPEMKDPASALLRISNSGEVPGFPSWLSGNAKDFLSKCLTRDSKIRWTAGELLQHVFFRDMAENFGEIGGFMEKSPTSVVDQRFWDSPEGSNSSRNTTNSDSPANRIGDLIESWNLNRSNWTEEDDDWITVRDQEIVQECSNSGTQDSPDHDGESVEFLDFFDEEIRTENSFLDHCNDVISEFDCVYTNYVTHSTDDREADISVSRIAHFQITLMHFFFILKQFWMNIKDRDRMLSEKKTQ